MRVRPVTDEDLPAIARIAAANDEYAATDPRYVTHLRAVGGFLVAEVDGEPAGYCGIRRIGAATMLTDLFVAPARHGTGAGGRLLDAALRGAGELFTFASRDPRAMSLYARHGMVPWWPLLYLSGPPVRSGPSRAARVPLEEAAAAELTLTGRDRRPDYAYWATHRNATGLLVREGDTIIAAGAADGGSLHHLITADGCDPATTLAAALATFGADRVSLCLPGPHPALPSLLDARWRIDDLDQHMASHPSLVSPASVLSPSLA